MSSFSFSGKVTAFLGRHTMPDVSLLAVAVTVAMTAAAPAMAKSPHGLVAASPSMGAVATFVGAANRTAHMDRSALSCFGHQVEKLSDRSEAEEATIYLMSINADGTMKESGTGFVARDSATASDPLNKIVTATHVVSASATFEDLDEKVSALRASGKTAIAAPEGTTLIAFGSNGVVLGILTPVATATAPTTDIDGTETPGDVTVLSIAPVSPRAAQAYSRIGGLTLAVQADRLVRGQFGSNDSPGIGPGHSGSPFISKDGLVHGVVSGIWPTGAPEVAFDAPSIQYHVQLRYQDPVRTPSLQKKVALPVVGLPIDLSNEGRLNPISDPAVLRALGNAGRGATVSPDAPAEAGHVSGMAVGFPSGVCRTSAGEVGYGMSVVLRENPGASAGSAWVQPVASSVQLVRPVTDHRKPEPEPEPEPDAPAGPGFR